MDQYCPNCHHFRDLEPGSRDNPPLGMLTPDILENEQGGAKYGCYCPKAWIEPMPMRVIDIQLLRAVKCGSFIVRNVPAGTPKMISCEVLAGVDEDRYHDQCDEPPVEQ